MDAELAGIRSLVASGWNFVHHQDDHGVVEMTAFKTHREGLATDMIRFRGQDDALGVRMNGDDPPLVCFECTGPLLSVLGTVTSLPSPDDPSAPRPTSRRAPNLRHFG